MFINWSLLVVELGQLLRETLEQKLLLELELVYDGGVVI
jgi:hypothetical protein